MKEYIFTVILAGMVGSAVLMLAPEGDQKKQVKFAVSLVAVLVCASPMLRFAGTLGETLQYGWEPFETSSREEYESIFESGYFAAEETNLRTGIKSLLADRFGIAEDEVKVSLKITGSGEARRLDRIFLTLYGSAVWKDTGAIEELLREIFSCDVVTAVG